MKNLLITALLLLTGLTAKSQTVNFNQSQIWGKYFNSEVIKCDTTIRVNKKDYTITATNRNGKTTIIYMKSKDGKTEIQLTNKKFTSFTVYNTEGGVTYFKDGE